VATGRVLVLPRRPFFSSGACPAANASISFGKKNGEKSASWLCIVHCIQSLHITHAYSCRARLALNRNDIASAKEFISKADLYFESENVSFDIEIPRLTQVHVSLQKTNNTADIDRLIKKLTTHLDLSQKTNNAHFLIRTLILLSIAYEKKNDLNQSANYLKRAIQKAEKGNWMMPFIEVKNQIRNPLKKLQSEKAGHDFIKLLLYEISKSDDAKVSKKESFTNGVQNNLSNREMDILLLLSQRLSNKEIANRLFISEATVKRHTITIYHKLDVHKRSEAVAKAKLLGLI